MLDTLDRGNIEVRLMVTQRTQKSWEVVIDVSITKQRELKWRIRKLSEVRMCVFSVVGFPDLRYIRLRFSENIHCLSRENP